MSVYLDFIRPVQPEDFEQICDVYQLAHIDEYAGEDTDFSPEGITDSPALLELFHASRIFVFDDGEIKGFVGNREDRIIWLYVHPDHRGQRIGQKLIDFMLSDLDGEVTISVIKSNKLALDFYVRRQFRVIGDFVFNYQGVPVEVYSMRLKPAEGGS